MPHNKYSKMQENFEKQEKELRCCLSRILELEARIEILEIDKQMQKIIDKFTTQKQLNLLLLELTNIDKTNMKITPGTSTKLHALKRSRSI